MAPSRDLAGAVVVITGASIGIGLAASQLFALKRARLVLAARQEEPLLAAARSCEELGAEVLAIPTDVTDELSVAELARAAAARFGCIDVWVNNAAVLSFGTILDTPSAAFGRVMDTNFGGVLNGSRASLPFFLAQRRGVLINVSSGFGLAGAPFVAPYVASKFAVAGFSQCLAAELSAMPDIHVCTLFPPSIDTPVYDHAANFTAHAVGPVPPVYRVEPAAEKVVRLAEKPRSMSSVGLAGTLIMGLVRLSPRLTRGMLKALVQVFSVRNAAAGKSLGNLFAPKGPHTESGGWSRLARRTRNGRKC